MFFSVGKDDQVHGKIKHFKSKLRHTYNSALSIIILKKQ